MSKGTATADGEKINKERKDVKARYLRFVFQFMFPHFPNDFLFFSPPSHVPSPMDCRRYSDGRHTTSPRFYGFLRLSVPRKLFHKAPVLRLSCVTLRTCQVRSNMPRETWRLYMYMTQCYGKVFRIDSIVLSLNISWI